MKIWPRDEQKQREEQVPSKLAEEGLQLAAEAQADKPEAPKAKPEAKAVKIKERRQRRKLNKQVRVKDQQAQAEADNSSKEQVVAKEQSVAKEQKVAEQVEATQANSEQTEQEEPKQRRNRRSPRHLRASGQRRRRGRDRRPNPFRLRKGGVASPEMAMGKVMPRFVPKPHHKQAKPEVTEVQVSTETKVAVQEQNVAQDTAPQSNVVMAGGFACPELAMGKVIIRRDDAAIIEQTATQQVNVEAQVTEAPAVIKEAPIAVETTKVETPVAEAPVVAKPVQSEEATPVVEPEVAVETPNAESVKVEEVPVVKAEAPKATPKAVVAKKQAGSPMTKAPGPQEIKEIQVVAAPFRTERFVPKGAGSQAASNKAGAGMTKPQY